MRRERFGNFLQKETKGTKVAGNDATGCGPLRKGIFLQDQTENREEDEFLEIPSRVGEAGRAELNRP